MARVMTDKLWITTKIQKPGVNTPGF